MTDIVERLRWLANQDEIKYIPSKEMLLEAADEIERLRTEIKGLRAGIGQLRLEINDAVSIILGEDENEQAT